MNEADRCDGPAHLEPAQDVSEANSQVAQVESATDSASIGSETLFAEGYSIATPSIHLTPLPEESEAGSFSTPAIHVTADEAEDRVQSDQTHLTSPELSSPSTLSPIIPVSPHVRRRSSFAGHRRRSSSGLSANTPTARRRSSIISTTSKNEFDDFQDGDIDGSEFGDFDDFVQGEFSDGGEGNFEDDEEHVANNTATNEAFIDFPSLDDDNEMRTYTRASIDDLFGIMPSDLSDPAPVIPESIAVEIEAIKQESHVDDSDEEDSPFMLTDRAVSLWKQLTAPPPLQPPDWKRSRIRRLFLVSLGIPVDLDEILPKMTHKKLVLPSTRKHREKKTAEERRNKKIPPPPEFEVSSARQLCTTTPSALAAMSERDLRIHVSTLEAHTKSATALLQYWLEQRDSAQGEKDTFEQVVQNLVQYHKKQKEEQREASSGKKKAKSRFSIMG